MTELLFRDDAYLNSCDAVVTDVNARGGIVLDRTVFYPTGGGQPGDQGTLTTADGTVITIATTVKGDTPDGVVHVPKEENPQLAVGTEVTAAIDWPLRHRYMRIHTCLHLLSALLPYPVTGGQISDGKGRLDFDLPEMPYDKETLTTRLNELIQQNHNVAPQWISDTELQARPELVKTMAVKPPQGQGRVRLVNVEGCDLQPCGGTHVRNTAEIGPVIVRKIEKKGRQNRRVNIAFAEA